MKIENKEKLKAIGFLARFFDLFSIERIEKLVGRSCVVCASNFLIKSDNRYPYSTLASNLRISLLNRKEEQLIK